MFRKLVGMVLVAIAVAMIGGGSAVPTAKAQEGVQQEVVQREAVQQGHYVTFYWVEYVDVVTGIRVRHPRKHGNRDDAERTRREIFVQHPEAVIVEETVFVPF